MVKRKLTKHKVTGDRAFHYFDDNGTEVRVACPLEEYQALALKDAAQPTHRRGLKWKNSAKEPEYDTVDGDLTDDSYAVLTDNPNNKTVIKLKENKKARVVDSAEIITNEIELI